MNDWPVIGMDKNNTGKGEPVLSYKKPNVGKTYPIVTPQESDEFNTTSLGLQWQWQANPNPLWALPTSLGYLRMNAVLIPDSIKNYWFVPNVLLQKFPAEEFMATVKVNFKPKLIGEKFGLMIMGSNYKYLSIEKKEKGLYVSSVECNNADKGNPETTKETDTITSTCYLRVIVTKGAVCKFSYSTDGIHYTSTNDSFTATPGRWIGAKVGMFCTSRTPTNDAGWAEIDWFRIEPVEK